MRSVADEFAARRAQLELDALTTILKGRHLVAEAASIASSWRLARPVTTRSKP